MHSFILIILLALVVEDHAKELVASPPSDMQDSIDKLVDNLVDKLVDWALKAQPPNHADLDVTTLTKTHQFKSHGTPYLKLSIPVPRNPFCVHRSPFPVFRSLFTEPHSPSHLFPTSACAGEKTPTANAPSTLEQVVEEMQNVASQVAGHAETVKAISGEIRIIASVLDSLEKEVEASAIAAREASYQEETAAAASSDMEPLLKMAKAKKEEALAFAASAAESAQATAAQGAAAVEALIEHDNAVSAGASEIEEATSLVRSAAFGQIQEKALVPPQGRVVGLMVQAAARTAKAESAVAAGEAKADKAKIDACAASIAKSAEAAAGAASAAA